MTVSEPDPSKDFAQIDSDEDREDREKDGQVYKILHDVKMEGEDPIADDKYYAGKDHHDHHDTHEDREDHKTQSVHMRQHEYDVNSKGHDWESHDRDRKDESEDREYRHEHENHKGFY